MIDSLIVGLSIESPDFPGFFFGVTMKLLKQHYWHFLTTIFLIFTLQACAGTPETPRETVAVAEMGYQEALDTATRWAEEGRLDASDKTNLANAFDTYEKSRNTARAAIRAHDIIRGGGGIADLDIVELADILGVSQQDLEAAQAAGQLIELLAGKADATSSAVSLALINLRSILAEVE